MDEQTIEIQIIQPGRPTGVYRSVEYGHLSLEKIISPEIPLPFDLGILLNTITSDGEPLQVILFSSISHPIATRITARLLGGIQTNEATPYLLAIPTADQQLAMIASVSNLTDTMRSELTSCMKKFSSNGITWIGREELKPFIKEASQRYRQMQAKSHYGSISQPAWQPIKARQPNADYSDAEHYTAAEYTFFQLPYHIQYYVKEYMDNDERILYSVRRPAMRSKRQRTWLGGEKIREGVLILTTQRLIHLVELIPLGDSGVRYGFHASLGVLERLSDISIESLGDEAVILKTQWEARNARDFLEWESPLYTRSDIRGLITFLEKFLPQKITPLSIRRSTLNSDPDLPPLYDPSSNDPNQVNVIHRRFADALPQILTETEKVHAWALWPAWFENKGYPQTLVVTNKRILIVPDPYLESSNLLEIDQRDITTLDYVGSILNSYIGLNIGKNGKVQKIQLNFPYTAEIAFHNCFEAIRRCMAVLPL